MIAQGILEEIIFDQRQRFAEKEKGVVRDVDFERAMRGPSIVVISGVRRCGKSTLLRQFADRCSSYHFLNFDDERLLSFDVDDFRNLMLLFQKSHNAKTLFFDEIQNIVGWERFVRRAYDEGYKIYITGSNARLLSSELSTHLTGRYRSINLFPFSFREFLRFYEVSPNPNTTTERARVLKLFDQYRDNGGFPEYVRWQDSSILQHIYDDILTKDLIVRFKIRDTRMFRQFSQYIFTNSGMEMSYYSLQKALEIKSITSVKKYSNYLEEGFLVFPFLRYFFSLKKQIRSPRKIYVIDNGLRTRIGFSFGSNSGRLIENIVAVELLRRGVECFYYKEKNECDFVFKEKKNIVCLQVTQALDKNNREREISGLRAAMEYTKTSQGSILVSDGDEEVLYSGKYSISVTPIWKWLLTE